MFFYSLSVCVLACLQFMSAGAPICLHFFFPSFLFTAIARCPNKLLRRKFCKLTCEMKRNRSLRTHKFIKCYLGKLQWVSGSKWLAHYVCVCVFTECNFWCAIIHAHWHIMQTAKWKLSKYSLQNTKCWRAREREREIMVFFVVHEWRNGNGSCFFTSEFLKRFFWTEFS